MRKTIRCVVLPTCLTALAALSTLVGCGDGRPDSFLLISIDTLRADHLGAYGYHRPTSAVLDRLAAEGVLFESVIAAAPWTLPSHVSMLSSLSPSTHGATRETTTLDPAIPTLATILRDHQYETAAFVDHLFVATPYGFDSGFDHFDEGGGGVAAITERALAWLRRDHDRPFFLFLHLFDVHCPYWPPAAYRDQFRHPDRQPFDLAGKCGNPDFNSVDLSAGQVAYLIDQYDGEIAHLDARLGLFFAALRDGGWWDDTLVTVTSDHGEEFDEHGQIGHERTVYDEVLRVPWILKVPGRGPARVRETVRGIDLAPTVLELLGVPAPATFQGRSLTARIETAGTAVESPPAFAELDRHLRLRSVHRGSFHLLRNETDPTAPIIELFDLTADPVERDNLIGTERGAAIGRDLLRRLDAHQAAAQEAAADYRPGSLDRLSEEERRALEEKLRSLGYLP